MEQPLYTVTPQKIMHLRVYVYTRFAVHPFPGWTRPASRGHRGLNCQYVNANACHPGPIAGHCRSMPQWFLRDSRRSPQAPETAKNGRASRECRATSGSLSAQKCALTDLKVDSKQLDVLGGKNVRIRVGFVRHWDVKSMPKHLKLSCSRMLEAHQVHYQAA